jgi:3-oxoacyl-[acyl-carrier protein] reductase
MLMKNETALITGSTSGIGKKLAEKMLSQGCRVAICSRKETNVDATLNEFREKFGDAVIGFPCDVSKPEDLKYVIEKVVESFGSLRILVANAGISLSYGPFRYLSLEKMNSDAISVIGVNLIGMMNSVAAVLPQMLKQGYGRIITLSGGGADRPLTHLTTYSASKGGVVAFSKCLAEELKEDKADIKLNIFQPGMLKTGLANNATPVPGWRNKKDVLEDTDLAFEYLGGNIEQSTSKVIPYLLPSCDKNGTEFRGFPLFKMIRGGIKLQKLMKKKESEGI